MTDLHTIVPELTTFEVAVLAAYTGIGSACSAVPGVARNHALECLIRLGLLARKSKIVGGAPSVSVEMTPRGRLVSRYYFSLGVSVNEQRPFTEEQHG